jgi:K+-sensing histidine kinase KdpD
MDIRRTLVAVTSREEDGGIVIEVADEGPGIPAEKMRFLFQKFSRLHDDGRAASGTGLGLAICRGLVEAKRDADGRWPLDHTHRGDVHFHMEEEGQPSRWNTLRARRVLAWAGG